MLKKVLVPLLLFVSSLGFAQQNVVKMGVMGVAYGDFSLKYERAITSKSSLDFTIGYLNPNLSLMTKSLSSGFSDDISIDKLGKGFQTALDYRFYLNKQDKISGFYLAPYLRYWNYSLLMTDNIDGDDFEVNTKLSDIGLGFQMGYHWIVYDHISIDWSFIGFGVGFVSPKMIYTTDQDNFDYSTITDDVRDVFEGWSYFEKRLKTTANDKNMTAKLSTIFPGIRMGLSVGYAF